MAEFIIDRTKSAGEKLDKIGTYTKRVVTSLQRYEVVPFNQRAGACGKAWP